jgi:hypothetical protein
MIFRLFIAFIVLVAMITAVAVIFLPHNIVVHFTQLLDFFNITLPILSFGALIKYLCSCPKSAGCGACNIGCGACGTNCACASCKSKV